MKKNQRKIQRTKPTSQKAIIVTPKGNLIKKLKKDEETLKEI